jgi:hypothetical protein
MRRVGTVLGIVVAFGAWSAATPAASSLRAETLRGWEAYTAATEARIARELAAAEGFLALDFEATRHEDRRTLLSGAVGVVKRETVGTGGRAVEVLDGMVHHWRGSVFIPGTSLEHILAHIAHPRPEDTVQEDVLASRILDRGPGSLRLYLRLRRSEIVTVVYNTEHDVRYTRHGHRRASSRSVATRIAEVVDPATPHERERTLGDDRGFLWGLNSYWRYEQVGGGVVVECESISLSRTVPSLLRGAVRPLIDQVARGSMERTLLAMRSRFTRASSLGD